MLKNYFDSLKDNPHGYWFKRRQFGWGWVPVTWQGWGVIFLYIFLISVLALVREGEKVIPGNPDSGSNFLTFALPIIVLTVLLILVASKKGEKPRWQWGLPKKTRNNK